MNKPRRLRIALISTLSAFSLSALAPSAFAQSDSSTTRGQLADESISTPPVGWMPYLGAGAGYTSSDMHRDGSNLQEGMPSSLKLLGSYYTDSTRGVFDLGFGYANQQFSRELAPQRAADGSSLEAAARYQWDSRWQAGVVMNTLFDRGELYGANQADAQFAGLQVLKEFDVSPAWIARVGGRILTDLNVNDETVNMAMIDLQIGWNPWSRKQSVRDVASTPSRPVAPPAPRNALGLVKLETDRPGFVRFEFNSDQVASSDQSRVRELAAALEENKDLYSSIRIVGHADSVGTNSYNQELSERRAASVKELLTRDGLTSTQVQTVGRGESQLAILSDLAPNFGDNRRVEIEFSGVRDQRALRDILSRFE